MSSSSSESEIEFKEYASDSSFHENDEDDIDIKTCQFSEMTNGNFILVSFKGGKRGTTIFKYVCVIENVEEGAELEVMGLKFF